MNQNHGHSKVKYQSKLQHWSYSSIKVSSMQHREAVLTPPIIDRMIFNVVNIFLFHKHTKHSAITWLFPYILN